MDSIQSYYINSFNYSPNLRWIGWNPCFSNYYFLSYFLSYHSIIQLLSLAMLSPLPSTTSLCIHLYLHFLYMWFFKQLKIILNIHKNIYFPFFSHLLASIFLWVIIVVVAIQTDPNEFCLIFFHSLHFFPSRIEYTWLSLFFLPLFKSYSWFFKFYSFLNKFDWFSPKIILHRISHFYNLNFLYSDILFSYWHSIGRYTVPYKYFLQLTIFQFNLFRLYTLLLFFKTQKIILTIIS